MRWIQLSRLQTELWSDPRIMIVFTTQSYDALPIAALRDAYPNLQIMGLSSHHGVFTQEGFRRGAFGLLFEGEEGARMQPRIISFAEGEDIRQKVVASLSNMKPQSADHKFIMYGISGIEERVIEGLRDVFGEHVDALGGSAGSDLFLGNPYVFLNETMTTHGVLLIETFQADLSMIHSMAGYLPAEKRGVATRAAGRLLYEIDGRPAPAVFDDWTDGMFSPYFDHDGELPRSAAKFPLGRIYNGSHEFGIWLTHVFGVKDNALVLYSEIDQGTEICLTRGSTKQILDNLKSALDGVLQTVNRDSVRGALLYFCAGCTNLVAESIEQLSMSISDSLSGIPFMGASTMGEQGCLEHQPLQHGNMMIGIHLFF